MTMKARTYYIIFGRPPIGGEASPLAAPLVVGASLLSLESLTHLVTRRLSYRGYSEGNRGQRALSLGLPPFHFPNPGRGSGGGAPVDGVWGITP